MLHPQSPKVDEKIKGKMVQVEEEVNSAPTNIPIPNVAELEDKWIKRGLEMLPPEQKESFLEKWKKMETKKLELFVERTGLIHQLATLLLDHKKSTK